MRQVGDPLIQARLTKFHSEMSKYGINWDGHQALPPRSGPIAVAARVLATLDEETPEPHITVSTTGGVMLEWETDQVSVLIDFHEDIPEAT